MEFRRTFKERKLICNSCKETGERWKFFYKKDIKLKQCKNCKSEFYGKRHTLLCKKCKLLLPNPLIHHYKEIQREVICKKCKSILFLENIKKSPRTKNQREIICDVCDKKQIKNDCRLLQKIIESIRKKLIKKENNKISKKRKKRKEVPWKEETKKKLIARMKTNNPMFRSDVRKKVSDTFLRKIKNGEIKYKKGHEHHLYKGNRDFSNECRKWLHGWRKEILVRDNFTCVKCGVTGGELHIHHIKPLRIFVKDILSENKIDDVVKLKKENINLYEGLIKKVVDKHKTDNGISVCKQCHADIDYRYRRIKKRTENENQKY